MPFFSAPLDVSALMQPPPQPATAAVRQAQQDPLALALESLFGERESPSLGQEAGSLSQAIAQGTVGRQPPPFQQPSPGLSPVAAALSPAGSMQPSLFQQAQSMPGSMTTTTTAPNMGGARTLADLSIGAAARGASSLDPFGLGAAGAPFIPGAVGGESAFGAQIAAEGGAQGLRTLGTTTGGLEGGGFPTPGFSSALAAFQAANYAAQGDVGPSALSAILGFSPVPQLAFMVPLMEALFGERAPSHYNVVRAQAAAEGGAAAQVVAGGYRQATGDRARALQALQGRAGGQGAVRSDLTLTPEAAKQLGVLPTATWADLSPAQFDQFLTLYGQTPPDLGTRGRNLISPFVTGSGDIGYLQQQHAAELAQGTAGAANTLLESLLPENVRTQRAAYVNQLRAYQQASKWTAPQEGGLLSGQFPGFGGPGGFPKGGFSFFPAAPVRPPLPHRPVWGGLGG